MNKSFKMKLTAWLMLTIMCFVTIAGYAGVNAKAAPVEEQDAPYADDQIIVVYDSNVASDEITLMAQNNQDEISDYISEDCVLIDLDEGTSVEEAIASYEANPEVLYAQPNYLYYIDDDVPDEEITDLASYDQETQWYLSSINVDGAWNSLDGQSRNVLVGVVDSGVDLTHPDLQMNIAKALRYDNGQFRNQTNADLLPNSSHGTHVIGLIAATAGNGIGIDGVANNKAKVVSIHSFYKNQKGDSVTDTRALIASINRLVEENVRIINLSLGYNVDDNALRNSLEAAYNKGIVVVCAGGNDSNDKIMYPAGFDCTIAVASVNWEDNRSDFSNYNEKIDIAAPGGGKLKNNVTSYGIYSTMNIGKYGKQSGTSMASPIVAGVAALLISKDYSLTPDQVEYALYNSALDLGPKGKDVYYGHGKVNAAAAMKMVVDKKIPVDPVQEFVKRFYTTILKRDFDYSGMVYWSTLLKTKQKTGADVAEQFIFSTEFAMQKNNNSEFVNRLYQSFFGREPDSDGKNYWLSLLDKGVTRRSVAASFVNSKEFSMICNSYGINQGSLSLTAWADRNDNLTMYVFRCYKEVLGRAADDEGLNYWSGLVLSGQKTARDVAEHFVFSTEFEMQQVSNTDYVKVLYRTFMGREFDQDGLNYWMSMLGSGMSRRDVFEDFAASKEFSMILSSYGL